MKARSLCCCRHTMRFSREPLIFTRQTDSADCRIVSAAQNKPFILNREVSVARPLPITKHNIHSPTETTTPEDRSVDNTITWWGGCVRRTISSNHLRSLNRVKARPKKEGNAKGFGNGFAESTKTFRKENKYVRRLKTLNLSEELLSLVGSKHQS